MVVCMQRVTNCILIEHDRVLLIKKPRRGWYAIPGGKMEQGETIKESVIRELKEETALNIQSPKLSGVFTFSIFSNENLVREWMMFTFISRAYNGVMTSYSDEGILEWIPLAEISNIPMAAGDIEIFKHLLTSKETIYGAFSYTEDYELLDFRFNLD